AQARVLVRGGRPVDYTVFRGTGATAAGSRSLMLAIVSRDQRGEAGRGAPLRIVLEQDAGAKLNVDLSSGAENSHSPRAEAPTFRAFDGDLPADQRDGAHSADG